MKSIHGFIIVACALSLANCSSNHQHNTFPHGQPHALLRFEDSSGDDSVEPVSINGKPVVSWRKGDAYHVRPGMTEAIVTRHSKYQGFTRARVRFNAVAHRKYVLKYTLRKGVGECVGVFDVSPMILEPFEPVSSAR